VPIAEATVEKIGEWMSGLWDEDVQQHLAELEGAAIEGVLSHAGGQHAQA
jgi:general nucleoside transport system ATP-binding protein